MQQRTSSPFFTPVFSACLLFGAFGLGACSLTLDTQKAQCSKASDCDSKIGGTSTQLCEKGFCVTVACEVDAECRERKERETFASSYCDPRDLICQPGECKKSDECGDGEVCLTGSSQCLALNKAECAADGDCDKYEGLGTYICEDNLCDTPQCKKSEDCAGMKTPICTAGRCSDPVFGCAGEPDPRPPQTSGTATYTIPVLNVIGSAPVPALIAKVCASAQLDPECLNAVAGATTSYDAKDGTLKVTGLTPGLQFRLTLDTPDTMDGYDATDDFLAVDFYTQVTPRMDTVELEPALLVPPGIVGSLETAFEGITVDVVNNGTIIGRVHDCAEPPGNAPGASFEVTGLLPNTQVFYLDGLTVLPDIPATTKSGSGGIANVKAGRGITVSVKRDTDLITKFDVVTRKERLTYINFYPHDYTPDN